jgi:hypothetical protein
MAAIGCAPTTLVIVSCKRDGHSNWKQKGCASEKLWNLNHTEEKVFVSLTLLSYGQNKFIDTRCIRCSILDNDFSESIHDIDGVNNDTKLFFGAFIIIK